MSNDHKASELLSKSFHGELTAAEQQEVNDNMSESEDSAKFAEISRLIQDSVTDIVTATQAGDPTVAPSLSPEAKRRLKESVRAAQIQSSGGTLASDVLLTSPTSVQQQSGDTRIAQSQFTLLRQIGKGGLGTVWLARDEDLKRNVAIKEMAPEKSDSPKHFQRFQREAVITGLLEHPNVVPLYMYGINTDTGQPFYAMRFLGKQTLAEKIQEYHARIEAGHAESIDLHRLLNVFLDVCQAIAYAHSRGVIHRDLKPENVALDSFGQVIVLDWGIAKVISDGELAVQSSLDTSDDSRLTKTLEGEVVGTPLYMAPEQAAGDLDHVDERTDVYGLGAILFSILTGRAPHENSIAAQSDNIKGVLKSIAEGEAPSARESNPEVPRDLDEICMRAMSNQRFARHVSAQELATDVERWIAGQNERRKKYDAMRLEANNLRGQLASCIRDFATNVRFMSTLPPIQGLIDTVDGKDQEGEAVWRDRLATIFRGLLRSNTDFVSVTYCRAIDGEKHELVRVERPSTESEARSVPRSRLTTSPQTEFGEIVMSKKPDDVHVAISPCPFAKNDCSAPLRLEAGVPVFDNEEEPFGMIVIEGDFDRLMETQIHQRNRVSSQIYVVDDENKVIIEDAERSAGAVGKPASDVIPSWEEIRQELDLNNDYVDSGREAFATRVALVPRVASLALVLIAD